MNSLIWVLIFYLLSAIAHIIIHRILAVWNFKSFKSMGIFLIGFFGLMKVAGLGWWLFMYILLCILHASLYTSPYLNQRGPSSLILTYIWRKKRVYLKDLYGLFTEKDLIGVRLDDLIALGHIRKQNGRLIATEKGIKLVKVLEFYRKLVSWNIGG